MQLRSQLRSLSRPLKRGLGWLSLGLGALHAGCVPVQQAQFDPLYPASFVTHFGNYDKMALVQFGDASRRRRGTVMPEKSYATGPDGQRYGIATEPHEYDVANDTEHVRERVYFVDRNGRRVTSLDKGRWQARLVLELPSGREEVYEFAADVSTFYYSPFLHGGPN